MKLTQVARMLASATCILSLTGCYTSKSVDDLTKATAANVSRLGSQLSTFAQRQSEIADLRAENMAVAYEQMSFGAVDQSRDLEAMRLAGQTAPLNLYSNLVAASERLAVQVEGIAQKTEEQRALVRNAQKQLTLPASDLASVSQALAASAEDLSFKDQVKFLFKYGQDVEQGIKQEMARVESAKNQAATNGLKVVSGGAKGN